MERWTPDIDSAPRDQSKSNQSVSIPVFCDPASETPIDPRDFGASDNTEDVISAGHYIMGCNAENFRHYKSKSAT